MNTRTASQIALAVLVFAGATAYGQAIPVIKAFSGDEAVSFLGRYCSACHDWAGSYASVIEASVIRPGSPSESPAFLAMDAGRMPPVEPKPTPGEIDSLQAWIVAGAPAPAGVDGVSGATGEAAAAPGGKGFLGFSSVTEFHRVAGWTSAGLLLAAGVVGSIHAYDMMSESHAYRDANGITEETMGSQCVTEIQTVWGYDREQVLRWTHVSLLVTGESLYLANAITGIKFSAMNGPGITKSDYHLWGFFVHGGLMVAEAVMGFFTTEALRAGDHELVSSLGVAHAAVGLAIPVVIIASGAIMGK